VQTLPVLGGTVPGKQEMSLPQIIIIGAGLGVRHSQTSPKEGESS
jgi:hypothetical protein